MYADPHLVTLIIGLQSRGFPHRRNGTSEVSEGIWNTWAMGQKSLIFKALLRQN